MDPAPLLKKADLLVTDYSSIYFDFLLLDRPIIFFPYDLERYFSRDRQFLFSYDELTPGAKVITETALYEKIVEELEHPNDEARAARLDLRDKSFQFIDAQASTRLWTEIKGLLSP
jgi:CDP-glycerol glycerophosphotransferase